MMPMGSLSWPYESISPDSTSRKKPSLSLDRSPEGVAGQLGEVGRGSRGAIEFRLPDPPGANRPQTVGPGRRPSQAVPVRDIGIAQPGEGAASGPRRPCGCTSRGRERDNRSLPPRATSMPAWTICSVMSSRSYTVQDVARECRRGRVDKGARRDEPVARPLSRAASRIVGRGLWASSGGPAKAPGIVGDGRARWIRSRFRPSGRSRRPRRPQRNP